MPSHALHRWIRIFRMATKGVSLSELIWNEIFQLEGNRWTSMCANFTFRLIYTLPIDGAGPRFVYRYCPERRVRDSGDKWCACSKTSGEFNPSPTATILHQHCDFAKILSVQ